MTALASLTDRYAELTQRVSDALGRAGRSGERVLTVAVTKYADPEQVRALIDLGHRDLGENKVQQLAQRAGMVDEHLDRHRVLARTRAANAEAAGMPDPSGEDPGPVRWHMIGRLQRNKAKKAAELCRLIQTVDSFRIAEELHAIGVKQERSIEVLVQVNIAQEPQKSGCLPPATRALCEQIETMSGLRVRGLMAMAPYSENPEDSRPHFAALREMHEEIAKLGLGEGRFNLLSMGMSGDYEVALEEGANVVRIGSALFGPRGETTPDDDDED